MYNELLLIILTIGIIFFLYNGYFNINLPWDKKYKKWFKKTDLIWLAAFIISLIVANSVKDWL